MIPPSLPRRLCAGGGRPWGRQLYPQAETLLVTADSGGSNSRRSRLWKVAFQSVADAIGLPISVCHFPPGTSKWNKIEHRMFCHITENWRGRPLRSLEVIVNLIANTTTTTGLQIQAELDTHTYPTGLKVSDKELAAVQLTKATFHGPIEAAHGSMILISLVVASPATPASAIDGDKISSPAIYPAYLDASPMLLSLVSSGAAGRDGVFDALQPGGYTQYSLPNFISNMIYGRNVMCTLEYTRPRASVV